MGHRINRLLNRVTRARWRLADDVYATQWIPKLLAIFFMPPMYWAIKEVHREMREKGPHGVEMLQYQRYREAAYWRTYLRDDDE